MRFQFLISLNLSENEFDKDGLVFLSRSNFKNLTELDLSNNYIGDDGVEILLKCNFSSLNYLNLNYTYIGYIGMVTLSKCNFKFLKHLILSNNTIDDEEELIDDAETILKESFKYLSTLNLLNWVTFYYEGYRLQEENKIEEAIKSYKKALEVNPKADEALNNLSILIKDDEEAAKLYRKQL